MIGNNHVLAPNAWFCFHKHGYKKFPDDLFNVLNFVATNTVGKCLDTFFKHLFFFTSNIVVKFYFCQKYLVDTVDHVLVSKTDLLLCSCLAY